MITFATFVFYLFVLFCVIIEVSVVMDTERSIRASENLRRVSGVSDLAGFDKNYARLQSFYMIIVLIGIFSMQWLAFLTLLLKIGIISTPFKKNPEFRRADSFISALILLFIVVNKYHLHINLLSLF